GGQRTADPPEQRAARRVTRPPTVDHPVELGDLRPRGLGVGRGPEAGGEDLEQVVASGDPAHADTPSTSPRWLRSRLKARVLAMRTAPGRRPRTDAASSAVRLATTRCSSSLRCDSDIWAEACTTAATI